MKFTNGFWMIKENIEAVFCTEMLRYIYSDNTLSLTILSSHRNNKGDILNKPALTVTLSAPVRDAIEIKITHFKGEKHRGPDFTINSENFSSDFKDDGKELQFSSGKLSARISKSEKNWGMHFFYNGKEITNTADKCEGFYTDLVSGK